MKAKALVLLAVQLVLAQTTVGLKDVYSSYFKFGSILNSTTVTDNSTTNIIKKEFNSITPENELKPDAVMQQSGSTDNDIKVSLSRAASILNFCQTNNIAVRGHTLVWHNQTPAWFFHANMQNGNDQNLATKDVMNKRMESFIKNVFAAFAQQYPNLNLYAYDVVNEAFENYGGNLRPSQGATGGNSKWTQIYGNDEFIVKAFEYARKYAPQNCKLFYNDYNEYGAAKRDAIAAMAVKVKALGNIDGIGMQAHLGLTGSTYPGGTSTEFEAAVKKFSETGLAVQVTELDVCAKNNTAIDQAIRYRDIMKAVLKYKESVTAVVVWGVKDGQSWRKEDTPLLFNDQGNKKAAYDSLFKLIPEADWGNPASSNSGGGNSSSSGGGNSSSSGGSTTPNSSSSAKVQATTCKTPLITYPTNTPPADPYTACFKYTNDKCYVCKIDNESPENGYYCSSGWVWDGTQIETNLEQGYWYREVDCPGTTPILNSNRLSFAASSTLYYSLKGEPLGSAKPQKAGVYIIKEGSSVKKIAVR
jgi:GH35 family endo-1,4-beta-xylanase